MDINTFWRNVAGFLPAILWAVLVAILSLISVSLVPNLSWRGIIGLDKLAHAGCYCILELLVLWGFLSLHRQYRYVGLLTVVSCSAFGIILEILQRWMHLGRQFEYADMVANVTGVFLAYCIFKVILKTKDHGS